MKKVLSVFALAATLSLVSCGSQSGSETSTTVDSTSVDSTVVVDTTAVDTTVVKEEASK